LIALVAVTLAVIDPFAAFLFIAGSQISPDPPGLPVTLAQMFVIGWVISLPFTGALQRLPSILAGIRYCAPFFLLVIFSSYFRGLFSIDVLNTFILAVVAASYVFLMEGAYPRALAMLAAGAGVGLIGYWGDSLGLQMVGKVYEHDNRGGERFGAGRSDVNWSSVNVALSMWTMFSILILSIAVRRKQLSIGPIGLAALILLFGAVPLVYMGARAGLVYLMFGGVFLVLYMSLSRAFHALVIKGILSASVLFLASGPLIWTGLSGTDIGERLIATLEFNRLQAVERGGASGLSGRSEIWARFASIAYQYPLLGAPKGAVVDVGEYGFAIVGEDGVEGAGAGAAAHNVFLDISASRGVPLAIMFSVVFFLPIFVLYRSCGPVYALPFAMSHCIIFLAFMNLSIFNYKTYWALHVLTAAAAYHYSYHVNSDRVKSG
jgi:hypothetical protein